MSEASIVILDHEPVTTAHLNALRAAVLGVNDGVVSVSGIILGVLGATDNRTVILAAGVAGLVAGALSMAVGEYVSVSSQRDTERAYISNEKLRLAHHPKEEFEELANAYIHRGLSSKTAHQVAKELTAHDAIRAHLETELSLNEDDLSSPISASVASLVSFTAGGLVPLLVGVLMPSVSRISAIFLAVLVVLCATGYFSAHVGRAPKPRAIVRVLLGSAAAMLATLGAGHLVGHFIG